MCGYLYDYEFNKWINEQGLELVVKGKPRPIISQDAAWGLYEALQGYAFHDDACEGMNASKIGLEFECLCGADEIQALLVRVAKEIE